MLSYENDKQIQANEKLKNAVKPPTTYALR